MKMTKATYDDLLDDMRIVVDALAEGRGRLASSYDFDPSAITMRDMWSILQVVHVDRGNREHPRHVHPDLLPRVLEFTDRSPYFLYDRDGENLDDAHIETALRRMIPELVREPVATPRP